MLLQGLNLGVHAERLMEILALAGVSLPARVIVSAGFSAEEFQNAIARCADAGLITADLMIETHPLFREFFWHRLHRSDYKAVAVSLAGAVKAHLDGLDKESPEFASLLPVAYRAYAMAGDLGQASALRRDLSGELESTAITLYNRRNYSLADQYIQHLLDENPKNWRMRLYRARIRIQHEEWKEAHDILTQMLEERPEDVGVLHAMGRSQLRQHHLPQALELFTRVIARRDHVASLTGAAECLHRQGRSEEALKFLERAKRQESENPFVLDLESRILEDLGHLQPAFESALLASARDPMNAYMHNRLGIIRVKLGSPGLAIEHFQRAMDLDQDLFSAANSLASAYLDIGHVESAEGLLPGLRGRSHKPSDAYLLKHTEARIAFSKKDFERSRDILKKEIAGGHNVEPSLGLLVRVELAEFDQNAREFPTIAAVCLKQAEAALVRIQQLDPSNEFIDSLRSQVEERKKGPARGSTIKGTAPLGAQMVKPLVNAAAQPLDASGRAVPGLPPGKLLPGGRVLKTPEGHRSESLATPTGEPKIDPQPQQKKKSPLKPPLSPPKPPFDRR